MLARPTAIALTIIIAACVLKWQSTLMPENTYVQLTPVSTVNAKSYFATAYSQLTKTVSEIPPRDTPANEIGPQDKYKQFTQKQVDEIIRQNLPAFTTLEEGLHYPYFGDSAQSVPTYFVCLGNDRALARALNAAAESRAANGDYVAAMKYKLDGVQMGTFLSQGSDFNGVAVGVAIDDLSRKNAFGYIKYLNVIQSITAINRLALIDSERVEHYQSLESQKQFVQASLIQIFRIEKWRDDLVNIYNVDNQSLQFQEFMDTLELKLESPRTAYDIFTSAMNNAIMVARHPGTKMVVHHFFVPTDPINRVLFPMCDRVIFRDCLATTGDRLLEIQLALHVYQLQHGSYPASLNQLVPAVMKQLPADPFSDSQSFKYRRVHSGYLLYSIGPDGVDNGGCPIYDSTEPAMDKHYVWNEDEKGDIVAGVNEL